MGRELALQRRVPEQRIYSARTRLRHLGRSGYDAGAAGEAVCGYGSGICI